MNTPFPASPHILSPGGVSAIMLQVLLALIPGAALAVWYFGWGVVVNLALAGATALLAEAAMLRLRARPVAPFLLDGSAAVTGILLGLALPPLAPWWIPVLGTLFAIVLAKHLYGGLGYNPFNPAMIGYAVLLIAFPREMTRWSPILALAAHPLGLADALTLSLYAAPPPGVALDALSMATPLDYMKTQTALGHGVYEVQRASPVFGHAAGRGGEVVALGFLGGGLWLIYKRVITWHIPLAMLAGIVLPALAFWLYAPARYPGPAFHVFGGAAMLGAFFIATDPVTACAGARGKLLFGAGCGALTYAIRSFGGYPDGVAFAVLLMNLAAPAIDYYARPRAYGHRRKERK